MAPGLRNSLLNLGSSRVDSAMASRTLAASRSTQKWHPGLRNGLQDSSSSRINSEMATRTLAALLLTQKLPPGLRNNLQDSGSSMVDSVYASRTRAAPCMSKKRPLTAFGKTNENSSAPRTSFLVCITHGTLWCERSWGNSKMSTAIIVNCLTRLNYLNEVYAE